MVSKDWGLKKNEHEIQVKKVVFLSLIRIQSIRRSSNCFLKQNLDVTKRVMRFLTVSLDKYLLGLKEEEQN
jgi:ribosomal protein S6